MTTRPLHPDVIEFLDDRRMLEAYRQIDGEVWNPVADALLAKIARRNLNL